jgi:hypothetical protein
LPHRPSAKSSTRNSAEAARGPQSAMLARAASSWPSSLPMGESRGRIKLRILERGWWNLRRKSAPLTGGDGHQLDPGKSASGVNGAMRKSTELDKPPQGNASKCLSYREAWTRIKLACEQGFYLEAVALQESVITDRLISYFVVAGVIPRAPTLHKYPSFSQLIHKWRALEADPALAADPVTFRGVEDLPAEVDAWREQRNKIVHGMVKSHPGDATDDISDFLTGAKEAAEKGTVLARAVDHWSRKRMRQYAKQDPSDA